MDYQEMFNLAVTVAAFFGGWTLNRIYQAIDRLDSDVRDLPIKYVGKDDAEDFNLFNPVWPTKPGA